jgi:thiol-disulfide isomerase/thioredoxin
VAQLPTSGLRGTPVVVDFCTYTCINWIRTLPYVRGWAQKYREQGLVVIGVHTPEFSFEKDLGNVRRALRQMDVTYPIAVDSDHLIWDAFANQYWPALYFIDAEGRIRHHRFGEGDYDRSEAVIQQLLADAGVRGVGDELVSVEASGPEAPADWDSLGSPETYLGYRRTERFASQRGLAPGEPQAYVAPERLRGNRWALSGAWTASPEAVVLNEPGGRIAYQFEARDVHLVMGPRPGASAERFRVFIDGASPGAASGSDVDADGSGALIEPRMYQLIRQSGPIADRRFEIEFLDAGAEAFVFTFG